MQDFLYAAPAARILFGSGRSVELRDEAARLGIRRALVISTAGQARLSKAAAANLGDLHAATFAEAVMHTPVETTERAVVVLAEKTVDGLIAIGGGSAIGLAKALALRTDLPQIALPTTYAGSEMTPVLGETRDGVKMTQVSPRILPETVIYDVDLTLDLPTSISAMSGMNAIAHAVEALYARDRNPVTTLMAQEAVRALFSALPAILRDPSDRRARSQAQYGAWLCGTCLGAVGMALHHKLCHVLGGTFGLPHAETHCIVLPHALAYNASHAPEAMSMLSAVLVDTDPARALFRLAGEWGAARGLRELGMPEVGIDRVVEQVLAAPYWNPRPMEEEALRQTIGRAWAGEPPLGA